MVHSSALAFGGELLLADADFVRVAIDADPSTGPAMAVLRDLPAGPTDPAQGSWGLAVTGGPDELEQPSVFDGGMIAALWSPPAGGLLTADAARWRWLSAGPERPRSGVIGLGDVDGDGSGDFAYATPGESLLVGLPSAGEVRIVFGDRGLTAP